jgi:hypothetical protein
MKIIIEIKDTAKLERIAELGNVLEILAHTYNDVIASIEKD